MKFISLIFALLFVSHAFGMERTISTEQRAVRQISAIVSSAGVASGLDKFRITATKTATGTYEISPVKPFSRDVTAHITAKAATCGVKSVTETNSKVTVVMAAADLTTAKDCAFNILVLGSDTTEVY